MAVEETVDTVAEDIERFEKKIAELEFRRMFSGAKPKALKLNYLKNHKVRLQVLKVQQ